MTLDNIVIIACLVLLILCGVGYWYLSWNVRLLYSKKRRFGVGAQKRCVRNHPQTQREIRARGASGSIPVAQREAAGSNPALPSTPIQAAHLWG